MEMANIPSSRQQTRQEAQNIIKCFRQPQVSVPLKHNVEANAWQAEGIIRGKHFDGRGISPAARMKAG